MEKHTCKTCYYCCQKLVFNNGKWDQKFVCTAFDDNPEVNIWILHFCNMHREDKLE